MRTCWLAFAKKRKAQCYKIVYCPNSRGSQALELCSPLLNLGPWAPVSLVQYIVNVALTIRPQTDRYCPSRTEMQCSIGCQQLGDACPAFSFNHISNTCSVGMLVEPLVKGSEGDGPTVLIDANSPVIKGFLSTSESIYY